MTDLNIHLWAVIPIYVYAFAPWVSVGAAVGVVSAYVPLSIWARQNGSEAKLARLGLPSLAALVGAAVMYFLALSLDNGGC